MKFAFNYYLDKHIN